MQTMIQLMTTIESHETKSMKLTGTQVWAEITGFSGGGI